MKRRIGGIVLAFALTLVMGLGVASRAAADDGERGPAIGSMAPELTLPSAVGEEVSLSTLRGEAPVVLIFFRGGW